ncbi:MAG TPA: FAD-dependent oxidoreductase [Ktedonobacteraceae bacterium]
MWLDRLYVQDLLAVPVAPQVPGAHYRPQQGLVHCARLVHGLMRAAVRRAYQANVSALVREGAHLCLPTSRGQLIVQTVVLAVNIWSSMLLPELAEVRVATPVWSPGKMLSKLPPAPFSSAAVASLLPTPVLVSGKALFRRTPLPRGFLRLPQWRESPTDLFYRPGPAL